MPSITAAKNDSISSDIPGTLIRFSRLILGFVVLIIVSTYNLMISQFPYIFQLIQFITTNVLKATYNTLWLIYFIIKNALLIIFNPLLTLFNIIDYNAKQVINFFLGLLFDTQIEQIITIEYGMENFKVLVHWIQFFNVVCLTGLIVGLLAYYYVIKMIYRWTEYEKKLKKKIQKKKKRRLNKIKSAVGKSLLKKELKFERINKDSADIKESLIAEFLNQEQISSKFLNNIENNEYEGTGESTPKFNQEEEDTSNTTDPVINELNFEHHHPQHWGNDDNDEEDITNFQSLNSLFIPSTESPSISPSSSHSSIDQPNVLNANESKTSNIPTPSQPLFNSSPNQAVKEEDLNFSPVTRAFRRRLLHLDDDMDRDVSPSPLTNKNNSPRLPTPTKNNNNNNSYNITKTPSKSRPPSAKSSPIVKTPNGLIGSTIEHHPIQHIETEGQDYNSLSESSSSMFNTNRTPMTPITTIEEENEDEEEDLRSSSFFTRKYGF